MNLSQKFAYYENERRRSIASDVILKKKSQNDVKTIRLRRILLEPWRLERSETRLDVGFANGKKNKINIVRVRSRVDFTISFRSTRPSFVIFMSPAPDTSLVRGDYREIFDHVPFGLHFECPFGAQVRFQHLLKSASTADVHLQRLRGASELGFRIQRLDSGHFRKPNARRRKIERRGGAAKRTGRKK